MNVAAGGSLVQDIPTEIYQQYTAEGVLGQNPEEQHRNYHIPFMTDPEIGYETYHRLRIAPNSHLQSIAGSEVLQPMVMSIHHQAAKRLGKEYKVSATSLDGKVVEAIEHKRYPNVLGVQFHPEAPTIYKAEARIKLIPGTKPTASYSELYPDAAGIDFHRSFWKYIAAMYEDIDPKQ